MTLRLGRTFLAIVIAAFAAIATSSAPARAGQVEMLPVAAMTIYPGDVISDEMLQEGRFPFGTSASYPVIVDRDRLIGMVARRTLLPGRLIARNTVGKPELVSRGTIIPVRFQQGGLAITASVLALQSGSLNEMIQVRNVDSGKVILAIVQNDGSVRVGGK